MRFGSTCHSNLPPVDRVGKGRIWELCCFVSVCYVELPMLKIERRIWLIVFVFKAGCLQCFIQD